MLMLRLSLALSGLTLLASATSGCVVRGRAGYTATATVETPAMVEVSPGVMVIEDYDEPVFYSDGYYWLYSDGVWLRSSYHTGGWVRVRTVPTRIVSIRSPRAYVRYHGRAGVYRRGGPAYRRGPVRRDVRDTRVRDDRHRHHH
jgi:hypothetical protein